MLLSGSHDEEIPTVGAIGNEALRLLSFLEVEDLLGARQFHLLKLLELEILQVRTLVNGEPAFEEIVIGIADAGFPNHPILKGLVEGVDLVQKLEWLLSLN